MSEWKNAIIRLSIGVPEAGSRFASEAPMCLTIFLSNGPATWPPVEIPMLLSSDQITQRVGELMSEWIATSTFDKRFAEDPFAEDASELAFENNVAFWRGLLGVSGIMKFRATMLELRRARAVQVSPKHVFIPWSLFPLTEHARRGRWRQVLGYRKPVSHPIAFDSFAPAVALVSGGDLGFEDDEAWGVPRPPSYGYVPDSKLITVRNRQELRALDAFCGGKPNRKTSPALKRLPLAPSAERSKEIVRLRNFLSGEVYAGVHFALHAEVPERDAPRHTVRINREFKARVAELLPQPGATGALYDIDFAFLNFCASAHYAARDVQLGCVEAFASAGCQGGVGVLHSIDSAWAAAFGEEFYRQMHAVAGDTAAAFHAALRRLTAQYDVPALFIYVLFGAHRQPRVAASASAKSQTFAPLN